MPNLAKFAVLLALVAVLAGCGSTTPPAAPPTSAQALLPPGASFGQASNLIPEAVAIRPAGVTPVATVTAYPTDIPTATQTPVPSPTASNTPLPTAVPPTGTAQPAAPAATNIPSQSGTAVPTTPVVTGVAFDGLLPKGSAAIVREFKKNADNQATEVWVWWSQATDKDLQTGEYVVNGEKYMRAIWRANGTGQWAGQAKQACQEAKNVANGNLAVTVPLNMIHLADGRGGWQAVPATCPN